MVKNQTGGNRAKSFARKNERAVERERLRLAEVDGELYAVVTKIFGGGMCSISTINDMQLLGHIRKKFSGRSKRNNIITPNTVVLIGLREWESTPKNCDILEVYSPNEVAQLKTNPKIPFDNLLQYMTESSGTVAKKTEDTGFDIGYDCKTMDEEDMLDSSLDDVRVEKFNMKEEDEICIDDI